ncbi:hypothetical protein Sango_1879600 [Sesamum angolense]|uniref:Uncharacterized protein n=1 Tax=Sesamum angolense TaxID=2727404 RepID=A0AAE1WIH0_9LAMI|nr:hypothetical protein Sango_1879600 [Sesamum angolense]
MRPGRQRSPIFSRRQLSPKFGHRPFQKRATGVVERGDARSLPLARASLPSPSVLGDVAVVESCLIDVYFESLIEELLQLWHVGVRMDDNATDQAFIMRATLMWTVNNLPAYGITSGWSTVDITGCPVCLDDAWAFHLQHSRKACYFDCHR